MVRSCPRILLATAACSGLGAPPPSPPPEGTGVAPTGDTGPLPTGDTASFEVDPCDACTPEQVCDQEICVDPAVLVFVNLDVDGRFSYDAVEVDADRNLQASDPSLVGLLVGYGSGPRRDSLLEAVRADFAPFAPSSDGPSPNGIHLVTARPELRDDYHMVVVTRNPPVPGQIGLGSPPNCGNAEDDEIFFAFLSENDRQSTQFQANVVSGAVGRLLGLGPVRDPSDLMAANFPLDLDLTALDTCLDVAGTDFCGAFNADFCPDGQQNTAAVLRFHAGQASR